MEQYRRRRYGQKKKTYFLRSKFFWFGILFFLLFAGLFYFFVFSSFFQINEIKISGNKRVSNESVINYLNGKLEKNLFFFKTKSIFLVKLKLLEKEALKEFPVISDAFLKRKLPDEINLQITEREAMGNWCVQEECYLIDKEGIIFEKERNEQKLTIISEFSSQNISLGEPILNKEIIQGIVDINQGLREGSCKLDIITFSLAEGNNKLTVKIKDNWEIYFDPQKFLQDQLFNLGLVLKEKIPQEKLGDLEYIDLRFGNKVYFKYKDQPESVNFENKD